MWREGPLLVLRSHSRMIKNISAVAIENFCESIDFAAPVTYTVPCAEINGGSVREINKPVSYTHLATDICVETKEGLPFATVDDNIYTLTPLYTEGGYSFDNKNELGAASRLLASMHLAGRGFTEEKARRDLTAYALPFTIKCCLGDTPATVSYTHLKPPETFPLCQ